MKWQMSGKEEIKYFPYLFIIKTLMSPELNCKKKTKYVVNSIKRLIRIKHSIKVEFRLQIVGPAEINFVFGTQIFGK